MRISDWSSDVCSSDLIVGAVGAVAEPTAAIFRKALKDIFDILAVPCGIVDVRILWALGCHEHIALILLRREFTSSTGEQDHDCDQHSAAKEQHGGAGRQRLLRSEEHTSELPSLMRKPQSVFCFKKKKT